MREEKDKPTEAERDEPVAIPMDPEDPLGRPTNVDPDELVPRDEPDKKQGDPLSERDG
jgi:hypothetical protein